MKYRSTTLMEQHTLTLEGCVQMTPTRKRVQSSVISWATITSTFNTGVKHIHASTIRSIETCMSSSLPTYPSTCRSTNTPLWFSNIQCDDSNTPHILRCQTKVMKNADQNNANICGPKNQRLLVRCGK